MIEKGNAPSHDQVMARFAAGGGEGYSLDDLVDDVEDEIPPERVSWVNRLRMSIVDIIRTLNNQAGKGNDDKIRRVVEAANELREAIEQLDIG